MKQVHSTMRVASVVLIGGVLVTGCAGGDEPQEPTPVPTTSATSPAPTPDPTTEAPPVESTTPPEADGVVDLSDTAAGIIFTGLPDATGPEAAALNAWMTFEVAKWESLKTNVVSADLTTLVLEDVASGVTARVDTQVANAATLGGTKRLSPRVEITQEDYALVSACGSDVDVTAIFPDQTISVLDTGASPTYRVSAELGTYEGAWLVQEYWVDEEACSVEDGG